MSEYIKDYILTKILDKDAQDINLLRYEEVIGAICMNYHVEDILAYIMKSIEGECVRRGIALTDKNIYMLLTTSFCVNRAYEYLLFLQNDCEPSHECEFLGR